MCTSSSVNHLNWTGQLLKIQTHFTPLQIVLKCLSAFGRLIIMYSAHNNQGQNVDELPDCVGKVHFCDEANQQSRSSPSTAIIIINNKIATSSVQTKTTNYQSTLKDESGRKMCWWIGCDVRELFLLFVLWWMVDKKKHNLTITYNFDCWFINGQISQEWSWGTLAWAIKQK